MRVYKGTDKNLQCLGYQFTPGKTEEIEGKIKLCERGFHACESPLDVFSYYPPTDGRYFEAELDGVTEEHGDDSKRVGRKITLGAEIGIPGLVKAHIEYTREMAEKGTAGGNWSNLAGGYRSNLAGGNSSIIICRKGGKAKAGLNSVIVLTDWAYNHNDEYIPRCVKTITIDGNTYKPDVWYALKNGEVVEV